MLQEDRGLDKQDCDGLVQLAFESYPDGHKDAIVNRIAQHLKLIQSPTSRSARSGTTQNQKLVRNEDNLLSTPHAAQEA